MARALPDLQVFVSDVIQHPEVLVSENDAAAAQILHVTKGLFDLVCKLRPRLCPLPELIVDGFLDDQIWEELQLQNQPLIPELEATIASLLAGPAIKLVKDTRKRRVRKKAMVAADDEARPAKRSKEMSGDAEQSLDEDDNADDDAMDMLDSDVDEDAALKAGLFALSDEDDDDDDDEEESDDGTIRKSSKRSAQEDDDDMDGLRSDSDGEIVDEDDFEPNHSLSVADDDDDDDDDEGSEGPDTEDGPADREDDAEDAQMFGFLKQRDTADDGDSSDADEQLDEDGTDEDGDAGDDANEITSGVKTAYEQEQDKIRKRIQQYEDAALGKKDWQMSGEVTSKQRPKDSLLETEVEWENANRPRPVITQEISSTLEELIKSRIKDGEFDDVQRKQEDVPDAKKRVVTVLDDQKSQKGLADIYEAEYMQTIVGPGVEKTVNKQHDEINAVFKKLCFYLDSLSNFHFTPKPAVTEIQVRANVPSLSVEEGSLAVSHADLLAPREVYKPTADKGDTEITREERKSDRRQRKRSGKREKAEKAERKKLVEQLRPFSKQLSKKQAEKEIKENKSGIIQRGSSVGTENVWKKLQDEATRPSKAGKKGLGAESVPSFAGKL
eukprot:TRINITY_DN4643_c0_g1_i1.p1 TRINITY_DN4643_c0_g1~~TRINITY_DN4643_c0_g1_i1.p1  ORF type:complete len:612 (+),score=163.21 TRINITY_DN4643_c0_g1_i1:68-1903(+)